MDFGAKRILDSRGQESYPVVWNRGGYDSDGEGVLAQIHVASTFDPLLGYGIDDDLDRLDEAKIPGFVVYGADRPRTMRIVTLGGSTTDPRAIHLWPKYLEEEAKLAGYSIQVFNGGVAGYASSSELLKLIRDVLPLEPDIVICLNGENDVNFGSMIPRHPMMHRAHQNLIDSLTGEAASPSRVLPNIVSLLSNKSPEGPGDLKFTLGTVTHISDVGVWDQNIRIMDSIARTEGFKYMNILQPLMGIGVYTPSKEEKRMLQETIDRRKHIAQAGSNYLTYVRKFYTDAIVLCEAYPFCESFVDIFANKREMYADARHQTKAGGRLLAQHVLEELVKREWLSKAERTSAREFRQDDK